MEFSKSALVCYLLLQALPSFEKEVSEKYSEQNNA
jgi:hypothetical protein